MNAAVNPSAAGGTLRLYAAVAAGSVIGSVLRWAVSLALATWVGGNLPWATLFANVSGSLAIGFISRLTSPGGRVFASPPLRHFMTTGVCGGYTTFSVFSLETLRLTLDIAVLPAAAYVAATLTGSLAGVWMGDLLAARFNRLRGAAL